MRTTPGGRKGANAMVVAACVAALISAGEAKPVRAADPKDGALAFVQALYASYAHGRGPDLNGTASERVFTTRLSRLIRADEASTPPGDVGALDGDPICDCQDPGGLRVQRVVVTLTGPERAQARVDLRFPDGRRRIRLDLIEGRAGWRVDDVHTSDLPSLVSLLAAATLRQNLPHEAQSGLTTVPRSRGSSRP